MWMMPLHLHVNQKSDYDMIYMNQLCMLSNFACFLSSAIFFLKKKRKVFQENHQCQTVRTDLGLFCLQRVSVGVLFDLILYIPVNNFSVMLGWFFLG